MDTKKTMLLLLLIGVIIIALRALPAIINGVTDPEAMVAFAAMNITVQNNYVLPHYVTNLTSSPPYQFRFTEAPFQVYVVTVPYYFLHSVLPILETAYLVKAAFVAVSVLVIILFCKRITGGYKAAVFATALFAIYPTANAIQSLAEWTGDFFLPILLTASILLLIYAKDNYRDRKKLIMFGALSIILLAGSYLSWRGGAFAIVSYAVVLFFLGVNAMLKDARKTFAVTLVAGAAVYLLFVHTIIQQSGSFVPQVILVVLTQQNYDVILKSSLILTILRHANIVGIAIGFALSGMLVFLSAFRFIKQKNGEIIGILLLLIVLAVPLALQVQRFVSLMVIEVAIVSGIALSQIKSKKVMAAFCVLIIAYGLISVSEMLATPSILYASPDYHAAMLWVSHNTPANSLFLTDYLDAEAVQYWGNRSVYGTSWWNPSAITSFSDFLYTSPCNGSYLTATDANYIIINRFWCDTVVNVSLCEDVSAQYNLTAARSDNTIGELELTNPVACGSKELSLVYENNATRIFNIS